VYWREVVKEPAFLQRCRKIIENVLKQMSKRLETMSLLWGISGQIAITTGKYRQAV
jgi:hypothetical protein